jgi:putative Ca2+/H+ antiporter (TMEM165/GDT1 family)
VITFGLIFVSELGDKTLLATLLLASRHSATPVLLGAWLAFLCQTTIALAAGALMARLPAPLIHWATVLVFAAFGLMLLVTSEKEEAEDERKGGAFAVTFLTVFAAEWGDATQLGTAALVGRFHQPVQVFLGAVAGLWLGTVIAVVLGRTIGRRVPSQWLRRVGGLFFLVFAVWTALQ